MAAPVAPIIIGLARGTVNLCDATFRGSMSGLLDFSVLFRKNPLIVSSRGCTLMQYVTTIPALRYNWLEGGVEGK